MHHRRLTQTLLASAEAGVAAELGKIEELESILGGMLEKGRQAWPGIELGDDAFVRHLGSLLEAESLSGEGVRAALERVFAADLFLACACAHGHPKAIACFERSFLQPASMHVRAAKMNHVDPGEVEQLLREKLFVKSHPGAAPKIALYAGRGPLLAWARVAATRTALSMRRAPANKACDGDAEALLTFAAADNPELEVLRTRYSDAFRGAFHDALAALTAEERNVLRLSIVDGLAADAIARVFGVHRATVVRRMASAREGLFQGMRRLLAERLNLGKDEFESLMGALLSQLDVSLQRVLAESSRPPKGAFD